MRGGRYESRISRPSARKLRSNRFRTAVTHPGAGADAIEGQVMRESALPQRVVGIDPALFDMLGPGLHVALQDGDPPLADLGIFRESGRSTETGDHYDR